MGGGRRLLAGGTSEAARSWACLNMARHASGVAHLLAELEEVVLQVDELEVGGEQHGVAFLFHLLFENFTWNSLRIKY